MKSKFCFTLNGKRYCFNIPVLVEPRFPKKPGPVEDPTPEPWIEGLEISANSQRDLSILATMNEMGSYLKTPGLQKQFTEFMRGTMAHLKLPKDVEVDFGQQHA
jgi:hypothetical protein